MTQSFMYEDAVDCNSLGRKWCKNINIAFDLLTNRQKGAISFFMQVDKAIATGRIKNLLLVKYSLRFAYIYLEIPCAKLFLY